MGYLIAITGTPGTGKTTLAKELEKKGVGKRIPNEIIERAVVGYDYDLNTKVVDEVKLRKEIRKFLEENDGIFILDSHLSHFAPKDKTVLFILLRCDPKELKKRLEKKGWDPIKVIHNVLAEEFGIIKKEMEDMSIKFLEFWTDKKDIKEIIKVIEEELEKCLRE